MTFAGLYLAFGRMVMVCESLIDLEHRRAQPSTNLMWRRYADGSVRAVIRKRVRFDAAHSLPDHAGKCRGLHGHSYEVELCFEGEVKPARGETDDGMVLDFFEVSEWWEREVEPLVDHRYLNETMPERFLPSTAENIASWVLALLEDADLPVCEVTVWETPRASATVRP